MLKYFFILLILFIYSCSGGSNLNLKTHYFDHIPRQIIWIQVPGLSEEHLAILKFIMSSAGEKTAFEEMPCVGKMWNYNLFELRPGVRSGFLSQIVGKKNIQNTCNDYSFPPFWKFFGQSGIPVGILESNVKNEESIVEAWSCGDIASNFIEKVSLWKMSKKGSSKDKTFHFQQKISTEAGIYFDKSCQGSECFSSMSNNFFAIYNKFTKEHKQSAFIIRDFGYFRALQAGNVMKAREHLIEINNLLNAFLKDQELKMNRLVLLSSTAAQRYTFPKKGQKWEGFEKSGKYLMFKDSSLMSPIFAIGAGAENYCGIFDESEILKRIIWVPEKDIINMDLLLK